MGAEKKQPQRAGNPPGPSFASLANASITIMLAAAIGYNQLGVAGIRIAEATSSRQPVPGLNDPFVPEQIGQIRADPPCQGMDRLPPVALGLANGVRNVMARQRLLSPPQGVRNEPIQLAIAEQLDAP
jgi:hypothetical protein